MAVIFLVGPTGAGKTRLSIKLAKTLNAEIISCDSMCVYKGMDVLTSKPTPAERKEVKHHLIDIISPEEDFSVARYRELALKAIKEVQKKEKLPIFVGGSGLYVKAVIDGIFPSRPKDRRYRRRLYTLAERYGSLYLYKRLKKKDSETAKNIHPNDLRRLVRALEIFHLERQPPSVLRRKTAPLGADFDIKIFGLCVERSKLYERINRRVEEMFKEGVVEEVMALLKRRVSQTAKQALGYKEVKGYLDGKYSLEAAKELLKKNTRHYAKRQLTWFRKDKRIRWVEVGADEDVKDIVEKIMEKLSTWRTFILRACREDKSAPRSNNNCLLFERSEHR